MLLIRTPTLLRLLIPRLSSAGPFAARSLPREEKTGASVVAPCSHSWAWLQGNWGPCAECETGRGTWPPVRPPCTSSHPHSLSPLLLTLTSLAPCTPLNPRLAFLPLVVARAPLLQPDWGTFFSRLVHLCAAISFPSLAPPSARTVRTFSRSYPRPIPPSLPLHLSPFLQVRLLLC